ncbi:MAG: DnaJ domain-containing protein [Kiritimatiellae bacterium]|nr:DnaJ domain-containing protein [Kiritimatiellia bacterium]
MNWRGKALGGSLGSMFGPTGALVGAAAGHFLVDRKGEAPKKERERVLALTAGALYQLALTNQRYSSIEDLTLKLILEHANIALGKPLTVYDLPYLIDQSANIPHCLRKLAQTTRAYPELACLAATWLWRMAVCDGPPTPPALAMMDDFAIVTGLTQEQAMQAALVYHRGAAMGAGNNHRAACATLGVAYDADAEQIKQAFRALSLKYHPDKHAALDPHIRQLTAEKFTQIKDAYETLNSSEPHHNNWYAHAPESPQILPAIPGEDVICFICKQPAQLPDPASRAHCWHCQALLAFERPLAEYLLAQERG